MSDALKDFIVNNRDGFDNLEPADLWTKIDTTIKQHPSSFNFSKISNMFKFGFGASVLVAGTVLLVNSQKEKISALHEKSILLIDSPPPSFRTPRINAGAVLLSEIKNDSQNAGGIKEVEKETLAAYSATGAKAFSGDTGSVSKDPGNRVKAENPYPRAAKDDSLKNKGCMLVDTFFKNIKKVEINVSYCDVNIRAASGSQVNLHGRIYENGGEFFVFGKHSFKKSEYKIKFEKQDSLLKVWMEYTNVNKPVDSKEVRDAHSVLDFELPVKTGVSVNNQSGNIVVSGLENKSMLLQTCFGNIKAEKIVSDLTLKSSSGNITLERITGEVKLDNAFGNNTLETITGNVKLHASSGNIKIKHLKGNAELSSSFGDQKCENVQGNIISNVASGNLFVNTLKGDLKAGSSFGGQTFENIDGDINSKASSGDIKINTMKGMLTLGTSFGDITGKNITLVTSGNFKTSSGDIAMAFLNDIKDLSFDLRASSGGLTIEKNNVKNTSDQKLVVGQGPILVKGVSGFGDQLYK